MYDVAGMMKEVNYRVHFVPITLDNVVHLAFIAEQLAIFPSVANFLFLKCVNFLFNILPTHVLDFSGLISSPQQENTVLKLHNLLLEKPLPYSCIGCNKFSLCVIVIVLLRVLIIVIVLRRVPVLMNKLILRRWTSSELISVRSQRRELN